MGEKVRGRNERKRGFYAPGPFGIIDKPRITATTTTTTNYARRLIGLVILLAGISGVARDVWFVQREIACLHMAK